MTIPLSDDELLRLATAVPQPRATAARLEQHRQAIFDGIAADQVARRLTLSPLAAGIVAVVVAGAALAGTALVVERARLAGSMAPGGVAAVRGVEDVARDAVVAVVGDVEGAARDAGVDDMPGTNAAGTDAAGRAVVEVPTRRVRPPRPPTPSPVAMKSTPSPAPLARELSAIVAGDDVRGASARLGLAFRDDRRSVDDAINDAINDLETGSAAADDDAVARLRRLRCELHLRFGRDAAAMDVCASFIRHHPDDVGARPLAFGAGGLAEELGLLDHAIARYTDAIVLAPLAGQSSADALKARARVHARMGHDDDARADLRVFLSLRPGGAFDDDVTGLATRLGLPLPR